MKLSKRKLYGGVVVLCGGALLADRAFFAPSEAAAESLDAGEAGAAIAPAVGMVASIPADEHALLMRGAAARLREAAAAAEIAMEAGQVADAFTAPESWIPEEIVVEEPQRRNEAAAAAERFRTTHRLHAVMAGVGGGGYAIIDGHTLHVGQALDGFTLVEVGSRSAVLESGGHRLEMSVPAPAAP